MAVQGWQRVRPIRVAFLVPRDVPHAVLDSIFDFAHGIWGGRFSPINIVSEGVVEAAYHPWLKAFDPDFIISFARLTPDECQRLYRELDPAKLLTFEGKDRIPYYDISHHIQAKPLSSLSTLMAPSRTPVWGEKARRRIFDALDEKCERSLIDSFGSYHHSFPSYPFPQHLTPYATTLTFIDQGVAKNPRMSPKPSGAMVHTNEAAWAEVLSGGLVGLSQYSALEAPRVELDYGHRLDKLQLVVGDSPLDRIMFWNARHRFERWRDGVIATLRVSQSDIANPAIVAVLADFLKNRNPISNQQTGGRLVSIRSTSLDGSAWAELTEKLRGERGWVRFEEFSNQAAEDILPKPEAFEGAMFDTPSMGKLMAGWHEFSWDGDLAVLPQEVPKHLDGVVGEPTLSAGAWSLDLRLDRKVHYSPYSNVTHSWLLSRRLRMAATFKIRGKPKSEWDSGPDPLRRVSSGGFLATFSSADSPVLSVGMPTDEHAFRNALALEGAWASNSLYPPVPKAAGVWLRPSDKGDYLRGLLGIFGGLASATNFLTHQFWRGPLEDWGCTSSATRADVDALHKRLKAARPTGFQSGEGELLAVAQMLASQVRAMRMPRRTIAYSKLAKDWAKYRKEFWERTPKDGDTSEDWDKREAETLDYCLNDLTAKTVLFQGLTVGCPNCRHDNWVPITELDGVMPCQICQQSIPAPMQVDWEFMINGFVQEALREHGLHAVVWALNNCRQNSRSSFFFEGPSDFWLTEPAHTRKADTDIDLSVVADGRSYIFEVKTSWGQFPPKKQADFIDLMKRIRPEVAVIAIMEPNKTKQTKLRSDLTTELAGFDTKVEVWTLDDFALDDGPHLY